jgi:Spy/CpxP family protein refolding chaperone
MKRYLTTAIVLGILAGGFVLAQERQAPPPPKPKPAPQAPLAKLKDALQITPEQEAKLKAFREARQKENKAFAEEMRKLRGELQTLRQDPKADSAKMNGLIDQIFKLRAERAKSGIMSGQEWGKIFTPEQLEKMKQGRNLLQRPGLMRGRGQGLAPRVPRMGMGMGMGQRGRLGQGFRAPRMMGRQRFGQRGLGLMAPRLRGLWRRWMNRQPGPGRIWD